MDTDSNKSSSSSSVSSRSSKNSDSEIDEDAERAAELLAKAQDLEAAWVGAISSDSQESDATFIKKQLNDLRAFMDTYRGVLDIDMMPEAPVTLLDNFREEYFYTSIQPMLQAKAKRDQCTVEAVFRELVSYTDKVTKDKATNCTLEELMNEIVQNEYQHHDDGNNKRTKFTRLLSAEEIAANRASHFKPTYLENDFDARSQRDGERSKQKRAAVVNAKRGINGFIAKATGANL
jgi:hypothetical protein